MRKRFIEALDNYKMVHFGDGIVLGVSGGPDSMAMLRLFQEIAPKWKLSLQVVHLNHGFRGAEADTDEAYVADYCKSHNLPCHLFRSNIEEEAKKKRVSFEEAGRIARYEAFDKVLSSTGSQRIAVAHNQNDQAETVLMRLLRGTGPEGLAAIPPVRGAIIRPLLQIPRQDIEAFCRENELQARIDRTNAEPVYHRNSIRLDLIPMLEQKYNPGVVKRLSVLADLLRDENQYMEVKTAEALERLGISRLGMLDDVRCFELSAFQAEDRALKRRILRTLISGEEGIVRDVSFEQIEGAIRLLEKGRHGSGIQLGGWLFQIAYGQVRLSAETSGCPEAEAELATDMAEIYEIQIEIADKSAFSREKSGINTLWIDKEAIRGELFVRSRREGDRFVPYGMNGSKSLKRFMIDEKIPKDLRDKIPLLCDEQGILWIYGFRAGERGRITEKTQSVVKVRLRKKA